MRRRLYFVLPDIKSAQVMMNELLLARISANHIHFLARPDKSLGDLPAATVLERSEVAFCASVGMLLGAVLGALAGVLAIMVPWWFGPVSTAIIPYTMLIGAVASAMWAGTLATGVPNHRLEAYKQPINAGKVLMIVSVPLHRLMEIRDILIKRHPEAAYEGTWPTDHVLFP